ncbi:hypothetical protein A1O7_07570 [Cladophialophora yegresii CBS 114405]|uniref:Heterokaryon incompatibility domain-containing protein n=1 Tax=Cladophialophora yegresii CBS 114405 TaxID=1182544 RepID=W9VNV2_9EURO|nr:uncharacterized protein A1O7_07570 [Cladophialophora yegresii CBS 114405]EXJ57223.1 hypothetical protein A1O7_07570 [Cladophialophora yegresii CBS 114405]
MDHFPLFGHILKQYIPIKLRHEIPYDGGGFHGFEQRAGFDSSELSEGLFVGDHSLLQRPPSVYASLIQSWFYWALLHECLQRAVDIEDYSEQRPNDCPMLTTRYLERDLVGCAHKLQATDPVSAVTHINNAEDALAKTSFLLKLLSGRIEKATKNPTNERAQFWAAHGRDFLPHDLELSLCCLGYTLTHAMSAISAELCLPSFEGHARAGGHWYTPPFLIRLAEDLGFCKSDTRHFEDIHGFVTACMAVALPGINKRGDHSGCTSEGCEVDNIRPEEYEQKHVQNGCTCSQLMPREAWDAMLKVIEQDGIPLVRVKPQSQSIGGRIDFEVVQAGPGTRYLAYSHVWADGRGNVSGNELYECQWRWLQECAQQYEERDLDICSAPGENLLLFWIDTFCVPRGSDDRMWQLRTKAILSMSEIYRRAEVVMVLDSALENADITSVLEFGMQLKFCGWSRRVWTLHEGAVAQNLMIKSGRGLVSLALLNYQMAKAKYPCREGDEWRICAGMEQQYIHAVLQNCLMINRVSSSEKVTFFNTRRELQNRATSYPSDRYLVMGIINQASKETLLALQRTDDNRRNPEEVELTKLKLILLSAPTIPQSVIFSKDARFPEFGMQWAPATIGGDIPVDDSVVPVRRIPGKGAIVKYKGWRITSSPHKLDTTASFISVKLDQAYQYQDRYKLAIWPVDKKRKNFATLVSSISPDARLAVILSVVPSRNDTAVNFKIALLVEEIGTLVGDCVQDVEVDSVAHVKYLTPLRVYAMRDNSGVMQEIEAEWLKQGMEILWCVG